ncbi:hypothetical protein HT031_006229 [Scenedesmus sp. PABB004]|nr:hypothetical protein HT031_006229 [Scenedesmus sp. PABB004]
MRPTRLFRGLALAAALAAAAACVGLLSAAPRAGRAAGSPPPSPGPTFSEYVVLSTGSAPLYAFFVPLSALVWRRRQRIEPVVLLVNDVPGSRAWGTDAATSTMLRYLARWNFTENLLFVDHSDQRALNNVALAQVGRAFVAGLCGLHGRLRGIGDANTTLVTTDADIWPVASGATFLPRGNGSMGKITNALCCGETYLFNTTFREFPMSTVALPVWAWRRAMRYDCICDVSAGPGCLSEAFARHINAELAVAFNYTSAVELSFAQWSMDQRLVSYRISQLDAGVRGAIELAPRQTHADRIDRSGWQHRSWDEAALAAFVDAHVLRPGHEEGAWKSLAELLRPLLGVQPGDPLWAEVEQYVSEYRGAVASQALAHSLFPDAKKGRL